MANHLFHHILSLLLLLLLPLLPALVLSEPQPYQCGTQADGALCPSPFCCSQWGWCGTSDLYCGAGCQSGPCHSPPPPPAPSPPPPSPPPPTPPRGPPVYDVARNPIEVGTAYRIRLISVRDEGLQRIISPLIQPPCPHTIGSARGRPSEAVVFYPANRTETHVHEGDLVNVAFSSPATPDCLEVVWRVGGERISGVREITTGGSLGGPNPSDWFTIQMSNVFPYYNFANNCDAASKGPCSHLGLLFSYNWCAILPESEASTARRSFVQFIKVSPSSSSVGGGSSAY